MKIQWWPPAVLSLLNLPLEDAVAVDRAVQRWAAHGEGMVVPSDGGVFFLFVDPHVVEFLFDDGENVIHVARVRRA